MRRRAAAALLGTAIASGLIALALVRAPVPPDRITISIVGTNDLHGRLFTDDQGRGGLTVLGGFVDNLRAARAADGGAVLVLDAGDTFQGGIESNLSEGHMVVDAYNAIGYTALAIGNHDFDYGSADPRAPVAEWLPKAIVAAEPSDLQGALKAAAARARFPFLAANILDAATGQPAALAERRAVHDRRRRRRARRPHRHDDRERPAANAGRHTRWGSRTTPLAATVAREAAALRTRGVDLVVLASHAGGWCSDVHESRMTSLRATTAARSFASCASCRAARCRPSSPVTRTARSRTSFDGRADHVGAELRRAVRPHGPDVRHGARAASPTCASIRRATSARA